MARKLLDQGGNEETSSIFGKLNDMLTELYASFGGATDPSVTTITTSGIATIGGALSAASAAITNAITAATLVLTGLMTSLSIKIDTGTKTASATAGAATLNKNSGIITSEALTTAALGSYTLTLTNSQIAAADLVFCQVVGGSFTTGEPVLLHAVPGSGSVVIHVLNADTALALNGTIKIAFLILKA
jgi:hypothetical protein